MGEALVDLERVLASNQLTTQEANILLACKARAIKDFSVGACIGSGTVWAATRRLMTGWQRVYLLGGAAAFLGMWKFGKSLDASADLILSLEGSRMQRELANIMVKKYWDNPAKLQLMSKHFYSEEVFDDSTSDKPKLRWRYRNFFGDNATYGQSTSEATAESGGGRSDQPSHDNRPHRNPQSKPQNRSNDSPNGYGMRETEQEVRQSHMKPGVDLGDPLYCVFGETTTREEIHHPTAQAASAKAPANKSHRRSHRRRRRHQEVPLDSSDN